MNAELINEKFSEVVDPLGCRDFIDDATDRVSPFIRWNSEGRKFRNTTYERPLNELMNQIDQKTREVKEAIRDLPEYMVSLFQRSCKACNRGRSRSHPFYIR